MRGSPEGGQPVTVGQIPVRGDSLWHLGAAKRGQAPVGYSRVGAPWRREK
jgi:hypothetical protein